MSRSEGRPPKVGHPSENLARGSIYPASTFPWIFQDLGQAGLWPNFHFEPRSNSRRTRVLRVLGRPRFLTWAVCLFDWTPRTWDFCQEPPPLPAHSMGVARAKDFRSTLTQTAVAGRNPVKPLCVGLYRGIESCQGLLSGAKWISSIHSFCPCFFWDVSGCKGNHEGWTYGGCPIFLCPRLGPWAALARHLRVLARAQWRRNSFSLTSVCEVFVWIARKLFYAVCLSFTQQPTKTFPAEVAPGNSMPATYP